MPPMNPSPLALSFARGSSVRVRKASKWFRCERVLSPREVLSRAVRCRGRELLVEPGGLDSVLTQERIGGGDDDQRRHGRDDEETLRMTSLPGRYVRRYLEVALVTSSCLSWRIGRGFRASSRRSFEVCLHAPPPMRSSGSTPGPSRSRRTYSAACLRSRSSASRTRPARKRRRGSGADNERGARVGRSGGSRSISRRRG